MILERHVEVLRAGFREHVHALVAGFGYCSECLRSRHVHDVQRHVASHLRQHDGAVGRLTFEQARTRVTVVFRVGLATRDVLLHEHVDRDAVLGVHHDRRAVFAGGLHRSQDLAVVGIEHTRVGHEQLERGDSFVVDEIRHVLQRLLIHTTDDLVERVVDGAVAACLAVPLGKALMHVLAVALQCHVDDGGDATPCGSDRSCLEGVTRTGTTERKFHVRVHVDATRYHVLALGVDHLVGHDAKRVGLPALQERTDRLAFNEHVNVVAPSRADYRAVFDEYLRHVVTP